MMQKMGLDGGSWFAVATTEEETEGTPAQRCTNPHCPWTIAETNIKTKKNNNEEHKLSPHNKT